MTKKMMRMSRMSSQTKSTVFRPGAMLRLPLSFLEGPRLIILGPKSCPRTHIILCYLCRVLSCFVMLEPLLPIASCIYCISFLEVFQLKFRFDYLVQHGIKCRE